MEAVAAAGRLAGVVLDRVHIMPASTPITMARMRMTKQAAISVHHWRELKENSYDMQISLGRP
jgi:hypothetical protein